MIPTSVSRASVVEEKVDVDVPLEEEAAHPSERVSYKTRCPPLLEGTKLKIAEESF